MKKEQNTISHELNSLLPLLEGDKPDVELAFGIFFQNYEHFSIIEKFIMFDCIPYCSFWNKLAIDIKYRDDMNLFRDEFLWTDPKRFLEDYYPPEEINRICKLSIRIVGNGLYPDIWV